MLLSMNFQICFFIKKGEKSIIIFLFPYKDAKLQRFNPFMHGLWKPQSGFFS